MDKQEKLTDFPTLCPGCFSCYGIEQESVELEGREAIAIVHCRVCGERWREFYEFARCEVIKDS